MRSHLTLTLSAFLALAPHPPAHAAPPAPSLNLSLTCANGNPMWLPSTIRPPIHAVILSFISKTAAHQRLLNTELRNGATIDPAYVNNQRVIVTDMLGRHYMVLVPTGMTAHVGDQISFTPGHADPGNLCLYTPNLIVP